MKTKNLFLLQALITGLGLEPASRVTAQTFTTLHSFAALNISIDGANPYAGLILSGTTLYGMTSEGGSSSVGTVFAVNTDGTGFMTLHSFSGAGDGANPVAQLILSGTTLYGTAFAGGTSGKGTVFKVNTDGAGFTILHNFAASGHSPDAGLILSGTMLYGTALSGGSSGKGTVFAVNIDGTGFTTLHSFAGGSDGAYPEGGLILFGNALYGTARSGGSSGNGTVFRLSFAPQVTILPSGADIILTWPTNAAGFDYSGFTLQATTNLVSPVIWTTVSPWPELVSGYLVVTNLMSGPQVFYRLNPPPPFQPCQGPNPRPCAYKCVNGAWTQYATCRDCP